MTEGAGDLKKAKEYNNCIREVFFSIPINQVGMHIALYMFHNECS